MPRVPCQEWQVLGFHVLGPIWEDAGSTAWTPLAGGPPLGGSAAPAPFWGFPGEGPCYSHPQTESLCGLASPHRSIYRISAVRKGYPGLCSSPRVPPSFLPPTHALLGHPLTPRAGPPLHGGAAEGAQGPGLGPLTQQTACRGAHPCLGRMQTLKGLLSCVVRAFRGPGYLQHAVGGGLCLLSPARPTPVRRGAAGPLVLPGVCCGPGPSAAWSLPPPEPAVAPTHPISVEL